eukprot:1161967-Pelagomonas_calceolata.AAC.3
MCQLVHRLRATASQWLYMMLSDAASLAAEHFVDVCLFVHATLLFLRRYVSAGASAAGYSLTMAIQDAFRRCTFPEQGVDADSLLFTAGLLQCEQVVGERGTGYERVMRSLVKQQINTFFGEIALNSFRRNVALSPITAQVRCVCVSGKFNYPETGEVVMSGREEAREKLMAGQPENT